jgi:hypothetical protein
MHEEMAASRLRFPFLCALALLAAPVTGRAAAGHAAVQWQLVLSSPVVRLPRALAIDQRGPATGAKWAYVTDSANQRVVKFGTGGKVLGSWQYGDPTRRGNAADITVGPDGSVFVANPFDNRVSKFSPDGRLLARWGGFGGLRAIVVDRHGNIYVAENQPHRITELSPFGQLLQRWDTRTLWNGTSTGNPLHLAIGPGGGVYVSTRCFNSYTCSKRIDYLSGGGYITHVLLPLRAHGLTGDGRGLVGIALPGGGEREPSRDACNNRFLALDSITSDSSGRLYVAGLLWPRTDAQPSFGVGLGPGQPGCSHDGVGPGWTRWPLPIQDPVRGLSLLGHHVVHGLAVDGRGDIFVSQGDRVWELPAG